MRTCKKCGVEKPLDQFRVDTGRPRHECQECENQLRRDRYAADPEPQKGASQKWKRSNPERVDATRRLYQYGVTPEQYKILVESQNGKCAICGREGITLCIDHCHSTGRVRGLLCHLCNSYIGVIKESPEVLARAQRYLER